MKKHLIRRVFAVGALAAALPVAAAAAAHGGPVKAITATPTPTLSPQVTTPAVSSETTAVRISNLKTRGTAEITRRITNLTGTLTSLNASTKLTSSDKASLVSQVNTEITGLTSLKSKLAADTTLAECEADVQSIVSDYRVYALLLPKVRMVTVADRFTAVEAELATVQVTLQAAVDAQKAAGKDTATLQTSLDDMQTKITAAQNLTQSIVPELLALQPSDYNTDHTILEAYRMSMTTALADLQAAQADAKTVASVVQ
jgi:chromosome segregation ATPase